MGSSPPSFFLFIGCLQALAVRLDLLGEADVATLNSLFQVWLGACLVLQMIKLPLQVASVSEDAGDTQAALTVFEQLIGILKQADPSGPL